MDDEMKEMVYEIHGDVKEINQHLENLNNKVERHERSINDLEDDYDELNNKVQRGIGAAVIVATGLSLATAIVGGAGV